MPLPLVKARAQVFELCSDNYISIIFVKPWQEVSALLHARIIFIRPVRSTVTYADALHELGHILDPKAFKARTELVCEAQAWKWAKEHALFWNDTAENYKNLCLSLYLKENPKPHDRHIFWKVCTNPVKSV